MSDLNTEFGSKKEGIFAEDMSSADFQLDAFLDDAMLPEQAAEFARTVAADAGLALQVDAARRIDGELRRMFMAPAAGAGAAMRMVEAATKNARLCGETALPVIHQPASTARSVRARGRLIGLATAMLLVVAALLVRFAVLEPDLAVLALEFERQTEGGFKPAIVCTTNEAFAEWTRAAFGQPLEPRGLASNVELLGWSTSTLVPNYAGLLLARVDGQGVMVVMDKPGDSGSGGDGALGKLRIFERRVGKVRLIEVTPLNRPMLVDSIVAAAAAATPAEKSGVKAGEPGGR